MTFIVEYIATVMFVERRCLLQELAGKQIYIIKTLIMQCFRYYDILTYRMLVPKYVDFL